MSEVNDTPTSPKTETSTNAAADAARTDGAAVDTGRRIDPTKLQNPKRKTRLRGGGPPKDSGSKSSGSPDQSQGTHEAKDAPQSKPKKKGRPRNKIRVLEKGDLQKSPEEQSTQRRPGMTRMPPSRPPPPDEENLSFADLLDSQDTVKSARLNLGDQIEGQLIHIGKEAGFLSLNRSQEGSIPRAELLDDDGELTYSVGDSLTVFVVGLKNGIHLSRRVQSDNMNEALLEEAQRNEIPVMGTVSGANKGGVEVSLSGKRAFCPIGQLDISFVESPEAFVGQTLEFLVREIKEGGRDIVLSRRALLDKERKEKASALRAELQVGDKREGQVSKIMPFGVFVDLGGMDGLIPMRELAHHHVADPKDVVSQGDTVEVEILSIDQKEKSDNSRGDDLRIGLSLRATKENPWTAYRGDLVEGNQVAGVVARVESFGAFVDLFTINSHQD